MASSKKKKRDALELSKRRQPASTPTPSPGNASGVSGSFNCGLFKDPVSKTEHIQYNNYTAVNTELDGTRNEAIMVSF
jgi:hypothetical protein